MSGPLGKPQHERSDINARGVLLVVLLVTIVVVLVTLLSNALLRRNGPSRAGPTETSPRQAVRLSSNPEREIEDYRKEKSAQLNSFGWVDREHGIAHIPIDRAMQILATGKAKP